jgi:hypothetical protein
VGIELGPSDKIKPKKPIETLILNIRNQKVILAPDLADVYAAETRAINQAVKRNAERFPEDFIFQLTAGEFSALKEAGKVSGDGRAALRSQIVILESGRHAKYLPFAFTEHGAIVAAMVLNSPEGVAMSVLWCGRSCKCAINWRPTRPSSNGWRKLTRRCSNTIRHCVSSGPSCNRCSRRRPNRRDAASVLTLPHFHQVAPRCRPDRLAPNVQMVKQTETATSRAGGRRSVDAESGAPIIASARAGNFLEPGRIGVRRSGRS